MTEMHLIGVNHSINPKSIVTLLNAIDARDNCNKMRTYANHPFLSAKELQRIHNI